MWCELPLVAACNAEHAPCPPVPPQGSALEQCLGNLRDWLYLYLQSHFHDCAALADRMMADFLISFPGWASKVGLLPGSVSDRSFSVFASGDIGTRRLQAPNPGSWPALCACSVRRPGVGGSLPCDPVAALRCRVPPQYRLHRYHRQQPGAQHDHHGRHLRGTDGQGPAQATPPVHLPGGAQDPGGQRQGQQPRVRRGAVHGVQVAAPDPGPAVAEPHPPKAPHPAWPAGGAPSAPDPRLCAIMSSDISGSVSPPQDPEKALVSELRRITDKVRAAAGSRPLRPPPHADGGRVCACVCSRPRT
jgi:hypothetical protein